LFSNGWTGRIDEDGNDGYRGHQFAQQLEPLRSYFDVQIGHACQIAARLI